MQAEPATIPIALTIAGSDPSGGAGIQADLKTFTVFGVYGAAVVTALTAQNTRGVQAIETVSPAFIAAQMESVLSDLDVRAAKTGMLADGATVNAVAMQLRAANGVPLIVDPVMVATSGDILLAPEAIATLKAELIPLAMLVMPNLPEAARLLDMPEAREELEMAEQGRAILALGAKAVLIKGGHGNGPEAVDILVREAGVERLASPRIDTPHTHGTGCTLSAAVTALLASGASLTDAVRLAKAFVWDGLVHGRTLGIGHGRGPVDQLHALRK
jgi:hydroxymethylpyrimidine/phosphomethylpyrimidine kinase